MILIPSIANADPLSLRSVLDNLGEGHPVHIDIEDGNFVSNITFGERTLNAIVQYHSGPFDVHLLTTNPQNYLPMRQYEPILKRIVNSFVRRSSCPMTSVP